MLSNKILKLPQKNHLERFATAVLFFITLILSVDHKYDKPFRFFSLKVIPKDISFACDFDKNIHFYLSDIAAIILCIACLFLFKKTLRSFLFDRGALYLWGFFFAALFSIIFSPFHSYFTVYTRLLQLLSCIAIYIFIAQNPSPAKTAKTILKIIIAMALFQALVAIIQYFTQSHAGLRFLGEYRGSFATFEMPNAKLWIVDNFLDIERSSTQIFRSYGTFHHCNTLGGFLALGLLSIFPFFEKSQKIITKLSLSVFCFILFFALCLTFSRSGIFGFIIATCCWFGFTWLKGNLKNYKFLAVSLTLCIGLCCGLLAEQFLQRGGILNYNQTSLASDLGRLQAQAVALEIITENPIQGAGFQQFSEKSVKLGTATGAHNIYLFIASEMGFIGLAMFLGFVFYVLKKGFQSQYNSFQTTFLAMFGCMLTIGFCDFYPILFQAGKLMLFLPAGLIVSYAYYLKQPQPQIVNLVCPK